VSDVSKCVKRRALLLTHLPYLYHQDYELLIYVCLFVVSLFARAIKQTKQTDQTTTLCVQEVEIYLERWEVLGALVVVDVG
jgi:hypothetical protein